MQKSVDTFNFDIPDFDGQGVSLLLFFPKG